MIDFGRRGGVPGEPPDPALDAFLADAIFGIDQDLEDDMAAPDLAAVVAMAHQMDPTAVPQGWLEEAAQFAPVIDLQEGRRFRETLNDPVMEAVIAQVRASVDHRVGVELAERSALAAGVARKAAPVSLTGSVTEIVANDPPRSQRGWYLGLAAAALLLIGGGGLISAKLVQRQQAEQQPEAAFSEHSVEPETREADLRDAETRRTPTPVVVPTPPAEELDEEPEVEAAADTDGEDATVSRRTSSESRRDRMSRLDQEAHAAWKAGDLGLARRKFAQIVRIGGRHRLADLAYGDMFTLARQTGDPRAEVELWKSYLRRFPSGRFADDARAGLCRRTSGAKKQKCWSRYLDDMPRGAYRAEAEQARGEAAGVE